MTEVDQESSRVSTRWRIVGWIMLTSALGMLAVIVTMRSVLINEVAVEANNGIVQETREFATFASEGVDPTTAAPFTTASALMERYLARQTPATGEALIGVTPTAIPFVDNAADDAGEHLAGDRARLQQLLDAPASSGVLDTPHGEMRWGRTSTQVGGEQATLLVTFFTAAERERVDRDTVLLFGVAAGGLLLTAGMAWLAARQILRPVRQIREVADSVDGTDLSPRAPVEGRDDAAVLADSFNRMLDRLERSHSSQRHALSETRRLLVEPRTRLEQALTQLAHDDLTGAERERVARQARRTLQDITDTVTEIELLTPLNRPDGLALRPTSVRELTARLYTDAAARGADRAWRLEQTADGTADIDADRVADAVAHLVTNAHDHTSGGDEIRLGSAIVEQDDRAMLRLWVANDGPRLTQDEAEALFEQYRSSDDLDGLPAMGLGLAVVRAVADAHGGSAWVESSDDSGTRFGLDLPRSAGLDDDEAERRHVESMSSALRQEQ